MKNERTTGHTATGVERFVGLFGRVDPRDDDTFTHAFHGRCVGVRNDRRLVRDMDGDVFEIEAPQFTPDIDETMCPAVMRPHVPAGRRTPAGDGRVHPERKGNPEGRECDGTCAEGCECNPPPV